jgi:uncharacterized membrane protein YgcG
VGTIVVWLVIGVAFTVVNVRTTRKVWASPFDLSEKVLFTVMLWSFPPSYFIVRHFVLGTPRRIPGLDGMPHSSSWDQSRPDDAGSHHASAHHGDGGGHHGGGGFGGGYDGGGGGGGDGGGGHHH